jgi:RNA polymerase sigma factor (sigma-70 family)
VGAAVAPCLTMRDMTRSTGDDFQALLRPHLDRLYRLAYRFTGGVEDAEDLVQELCARLYPRLAELQALDNAAPWLARALHNLFVDQVRRAARSPVEAVAELPEVPSPAPGPEDAVARELTLDRIEAALARLPPEQRAVLAWHDIEGYTLEELADSHELPLGTLKSRLHRARAALKRLLA